MSGAGGPAGAGAPPRAIVLAAGRGERMRPLTDQVPKPLLTVRGRPLIEWHLEALAAAGVREVVVNTAWLGEQFPARLGDGARFGLVLRYSEEARDHGQALETAGGIAKALPWLGEVFWVVSGDVYTPGFRFEAAHAARFAAGRDLAHLWLVPNAPHHPAGDFAIVDGRARSGPPPRLTWSSIGLYRAEMFRGLAVGTRAPLRPLLDAAIAADRLGAERWDGAWTDVGTPQRLAALNAD
ncbi:N-acetylmuramate alpha-1-phosphate uridylyltransferase MurU [Piscinibacter sakaiensis]|uniref:Glucose-1-phosphate thymidylyltransferase n=1 Tax=Piscinibacter sakaiensis TaxID=1547922 RepID=A0A0K8NVS2_PISS1|nr:nucleotidyltransferase family protein [Piscinibacter sakaiensis]GAP34478.1 glucose-1-phosphate thymidylyltransferase [Piscinibacter sakaiensis]